MYFFSSGRKLTVPNSASSTANNNNGNHLVLMEMKGKIVRNKGAVFLTNSRSKQECLSVEGPPPTR